jgi:hypothetical protein
METPSDLRLTEDERDHLNALQRTAREHIYQLGQLEIQKYRLLATLSDVEEKAQETLRSAGTRLGISPETPWQMTSDGRVIFVDAAGRPAST